MPERTSDESTNSCKRLRVSLGFRSVNRTKHHIVFEPVMNGYVPILADVLKSSGCFNRADPYFPYIVVRLLAKSIWICISKTASNQIRLENAETRKVVPDDTLHRTNCVQHLVSIIGLVKTRF